MPVPLMPKATAVWLVEHTALTFEQIADFCGLHPLEVQAIADGEVAPGMTGLDPVANGQLAQEEIDKAVADPKYRMPLGFPRGGERPAAEAGPPDPKTTAACSRHAPASARKK